MLERKAAANKLLLLGIDAMDPRLTKKFVAMGLMPNMKKYIENGACRDDLVMLGGHPTVTPPMWTTLACGCYANVHGITGYLRCGKDIDLVDYNLDSRNCHAEPLWNVFAEAGKKTLVFHWPGSSWPPTSDNSNLMVIDGTSPGAVGMSTAQIESEYLVGASEDIKEVTFLPKAPIEANAACVITDLEIADVSDNDVLGNFSNTSVDVQRFIWDRSQISASSSEAYIDIMQSPIKPAQGWLNVPNDAKEFTILFSKGAIRRPALILKNNDGIYDSVAIYKNKKSEKPIVVCPIGKMMTQFIDESVKDNRVYKVNRNLKLLRLDKEGSSLTMYISGAMDIANDSVYHPKRLYQEIVDHTGYPTPTSFIGRQDSMLITECMLENWYVSTDWHADAIHCLIEKENLDVVFSHYHAIDLQAHQFIKHLANRPFNRNPISVAEKWIQDLYIQTDYYLGKFLHFLNEGWTICIFSDHAQVASAHEIPLLIEDTGVCIPIMEQLGLTVPIRNDEGKVIGIDWGKTKAVMQREGHIYLNLIGRSDHGIVDPKDKYELEEEIMTKLYSLTDPETGHRIVSVALRNRDAVLLGMGGPESGDIFCCHAEGYNTDHNDCLSTTFGEGDTSVSPLFVAAGPGIKKGYKTDRIIRQIDFAPTIAVLGGVRMPAQCEGAPIYQILSKEY